MEDKDKTLESFGKFLDVIARLRGPDGCPWDREQTAESLRGDLLEEAYEAVEAINEKDPSHVREELGDVLLVTALIARIHAEESLFDMNDVIEDIRTKLIRRHPHVFGTAEVSGTDEVLENWERIKVEVEGREKKSSVIDGVPMSLPPLERSYKIQKKAAKCGFDWPDVSGPEGKVLEEAAEVKEAALKNDMQAVEAELGDLLFSVVNLARHYKVDPALALSRTNAKFERRFRAVETRMAGDGEEMSPDNLLKMDGYWDEVKSMENA